MHSLTRATGTVSASIGTRNRAPTRFCDHVSTTITYGLWGTCSRSGSYRAGSYRRTLRWDSSSRPGPGSHTCRRSRRTRGLRMGVMYVCLYRNFPVQKNRRFGPKTLGFLSILGLTKVQGCQFRNLRARPYMTDLENSALKAKTLVS